MPSSKLSEVEMQSLAAFRLAENLPKERQPIHYASMLHPVQLEEVLTMIRERMGAPNLRVAASIMIKRMAFYAVIHLYAMTKLRKGLIVDRNNVLLAEHIPSNLWLPDFYFGEIAFEVEQEDRSAWRDAIVQHVFSEMLTPLIKILSKQVKLPERVMWENVAQYIFWLYEEMIRTAQSAKLKHSAQEDLDYVIYNAQGELFGSYEKNPLAPNEPDSIRKTCCLAYLLDNVEKMCPTCPIPVHRERT